MTFASGLGILFLSFWAVATVAYAFRVPRLYPLLKRVNWFRSFAHWTMFSAGSDPRRYPGNYEIERREKFSDGSFDNWRTIVSGYRWVPYGVLADPRRHLAARIHALGQLIESTVDNRNESDSDKTLVSCAKLIEECFGDAEAEHEFRVVKRYGANQAAPDRILWQSLECSPAPDHDTKH